MKKYYGVDLNNTNRRTELYADRDNAVWVCKVLWSVASASTEFEIHEVRSNVKM